MKVRYGREKEWFNKPRRQRNPDTELSKSKRKHDGRGPDTLDELTKRKKLNTSDGRPPDTKKALTAKKGTKPLKQQILQFSVPDPTIVVYTSYVWQSNSCWLDTSLEILYHGFLRNRTDFNMAFGDLPEKTGFREICDMFNMRHSKGPSCSSKDLSDRRNRLRELLHQERRVMLRHIGSAQPLLVREFFVLGHSPSRKIMLIHESQSHGCGTYYRAKTIQRCPLGHVLISR